MREGRFVRGVAQVDGEELEPGVHEVDVGVVEPGDDHPAVEGHDPGPRTRLREQVLPFSEGRHPAVAEEDGLRLGETAARPHPPPPEEEVH
jgi:hypothetical protein